jgi:hypothetical protein
MADQLNERNQRSNFRNVFREPANGTRFGVVALVPDPASSVEDEEAVWESFPIAYSYDSASDTHAIEILRYEVDWDNKPEADLIAEDAELEAIWYWAEQSDGEAILREYKSLGATAVGVIDQLLRFSNGSSTQPLDRMKNGVRAHIEVARRTGVSREEVGAVLQSIIGEQGEKA